MGTAVKRPYRSEIRAKRAQATRERILAAARRLFAESGYVTTTVEQIAARARVAPATVYLAFGSKRAILLALVASVGRDAETQRLEDEIRREPSLHRRIELTARITRVITENAWDVMEVGRVGAGTDSDLAVAWRQGTQGRHEAVANALRPVLPRGSEATIDLIWAVTGPELFGLLVVDRGWSADRYEAALRDLLAGIVASAARRPRRRTTR